MNRVAHLLSCLTAAAVLASAGTLMAQSQAKQLKKQTAGKALPRSTGTTFIVKKEPVKEIVMVTGAFEAVDMKELSVQVREWTTLTVREAVPHGKRVKQGDRLATFDAEKLDRAIRDLEWARPLAEVARQQAEHNLKMLEKSLPGDLETAKRAKLAADEDLERFLKTDRKQSTKSAEFSVKTAANYLAYQQEELRQLEKMYRADDLAEESEEIILKRQRDTVERATFSLEQAKLNRDKTLQVTLPRKEKSLKEAVRTQTLALERAEAATMTLRKTRLEYEKLQRDQEKTAERMSRLQKDRQAMDVRASFDGIVYYGQCVRGNWPGIAAMEAKLRPGGTLKPNERFMTLVKPSPMQVRTAVPEKDLAGLKPGTRATIQPAGFPRLKLSGTLQSVSFVPFAPGKFDAKIALPQGKPSGRIMPGMACTVRLVVYENPSALTVPAAAVVDGDPENGSASVYVPTKDGPPEKRPVSGRKIGDKFVIEKGLKVGDKVLSGKKRED